jgi:hypothetical protein
MFSQWPSWLSQSPRIRRIAIKTWRLFLRVQRATLAKAVLVVQRQDGRVLALSSSTGELRLPTKELDGWRAVTTQVEELLESLLRQSATPKLKAILGAPGREGITLLYILPYPHAPDLANRIWLHPDVASLPLTAGDRRLLLLAKLG